MIKQRIRNILLALSTSALFLAAAAIGLIVARGNIITDDGLSQTGSIRISITPSSGYQAYLNEQIQKVSSNNAITGVIPGEYDLRIAKKGYSEWQQHIEVRAGLVTDVSVQLFPGKIPPEQLTKSNVDRFFFSQSRQYAYYSTISHPLGSNLGIWQQPLQQSNIPLIEEGPIKITNLTSNVSKDIRKGTFSIIPSPNDSKLLLRTSDSMYVLDAGRYNEPNTANEVTVTYPVDEVLWLSPSQNLLIRSGDMLLDYDIEDDTASIISLVPDTTPVFAKTNNTLVFMEHGQLYRYTPGQKEVVKLPNISLPENIDKILASRDNDQNLVLKAGKQIYFLNTTDSYLQRLGAYELISISPSARNLIVRENKGKIKSIEVDISLLRNTVEVFTRSTALSDKLIPGSITWAPNSTYMIFQNSDRENQIYTVDNTGNNLNTLYTAESNLTGKFEVVANNTGLILKLEDSKSTASNPRANLYKLEYE